MRKIIDKVKFALKKGFNLKEPQDVVLSGFDAYDKMFRQSVLEQAQGALGKFRRELPVKSFHIHVKGKTHAKGKQLYELKGTLLLEDNTAIHAESSNKEIFYAMKFLLKELRALVLKKKSKRDYKHWEKFEK